MIKQMWIEIETNDLLENVSMGGSEPLVTKH